MFKSIKNGVVVTSVLDSRTINKEGTYPIKIKVYYRRKPKYYSVGICMSKDEWDKLPDSRYSEGRCTNNQTHLYLKKSPCSCVSGLAVDEILQKNDLAAISESELLKPLVDKGTEEILITDKVDC